MNYTAVSIKDTRDNLSEIIERVAIAGDVFAVTKFGKLKAMIIPMVETKKVDDKTKILEETFGIWKDRKDITNSVKWVRDLRKKESTRYGKIFG